MFKKTVAVDLDDVLADYSEGWQGIDKIGEPIKGAKEFLLELSEFAEVLIYTTRCNAGVSDRDGRTPFQLELIVRKWLTDHNLKFDKVWVGQGKPLCAAIIDDRAIQCTPRTDARAYPSALVKAKRFCGAASKDGDAK